MAAIALKTFTSPFVKSADDRDALQDISHESNGTKMEPDEETVYTEKEVSKSDLERVVYKKWNAARVNLQRFDMAAKGIEKELVLELRKAGFSIPMDSTFIKVAEQVTQQRQTNMKQWNPSTPSKSLQAFLQLIEERAELVSIEKTTYEAYRRFTGAAL